MSRSSRFKQSVCAANAVKARQQAQAAKLVRDVKALEATIGRERSALVLTSSACSSPI
jgi:hypothetical protein